MAACSLRKHFKVLWALCEVFIFGGITVGWGALVFVLKADGLHQELCEREQNNKSTGNDDILKSDCNGQDLRLNLYYTIATSATYVIVVAGGVVFSRYGTWIARVILTIIYSSGCLFMAFASQDVPWLVLPGVTFLFLGGLMLLVISSQLSNLYAGNNQLFIGLLNGIFDASSVSTLFIKIATENGIERRYSLIILSVLSLVSLLSSTFIVFPKGFIDKRQASETYTATYEASELAENEGETTKKPMQTTSGPPGTTWLYLRSPVYLLHLLWYSISLMHFLADIGTVNAHIEMVTRGNNEDVSYYTNVLSYTLFCGFVTSLLSGFLYDTLKKLYRDDTSSIRRKLLPPVIPLSVICFSQLLLSSLMMVDNPASLYVLFIVLTVYRSFLFLMIMGFIVDIFPIHTVGTLITVCTFPAAALNGANYGLFYWAENVHNGWIKVQIFRLCLGSICFLHPLALFLCTRKTKSGYTKGWRKVYLGECSKLMFSTTVNEEMEGKEDTYL